MRVTGRKASEGLKKCLNVIHSRTLAAPVQHVGVDQGGRDSLCGLEAPTRRGRRSRLLGAA